MSAGRASHRALTTSAAVPYSPSHRRLSAPGSPGLAGTVVAVSTLATMNRSTLAMGTPVLAHPVPHVASSSSPPSGMSSSGSNHPRSAWRSSEVSRPPGVVLPASSNSTPSARSTSSGSRVSLRLDHRKPSLTRPSKVRTRYAFGSEGFATMWLPTACAAVPASAARSP